MVFELNLQWLAMTRVGVFRGSKSPNLGGILREHTRTETTHDISKHQDHISVTPIRIYWQAVLSQLAWNLSIGNLQVGMIACWSLKRGLKYAKHGQRYAGSALHAHSCVMYVI